MCRFAHRQCVLRDAFSYHTMENIMWPVSYDSLPLPFAPEWHHEPGFSEAFVGDLHKAFDYLESATKDPCGYFYAAAVVLPYRTKPLSVRQRLHLEYALAQAFAGDGDLKEALIHLEEAADMADFLDDRDAGATIGHAAGLTYHYLSEFALARSFYGDSLALLRSLETDTGPANATREIELLMGIAGLDCELVDFAHADVATRQARYLLLSSESPTTTEADHARLDWIDALVANWTGRPDRALALAQATAATYERLGMHQLAGRANVMTVEFALDLAGNFSFENHPHLRAAFAYQARPHAMAAIEYARATKDRVGKQLGYLALQRCRRLRGPTQDGIAVVERVIRQAKRLGDPALLGRAYMALGDELAAQARFDAARQLYGMARHIFEEFELHMLVAWPSRYLLRSDAF
jgi:tetratricopeptide (TPR) repeat protein